MKRKVFTLSATFLLMVLFLTSCNKDGKLGSDVLDSGDLLNSSQIDTFSLQTFTIEQDSVITDNPAYTMLGSYNDPVFGKVDASFYTQFQLEGLNPVFGSSVVIDSIMLGLEYVSSYGDFSPQYLEVFQMTEGIDLESTYYSFTTKSHSSTNLVQPGYETFTPNPSGLTVIDNDTVDTQLRIRLRNSFAQILVDEAKSGGSNFSSNENFNNYFKGLYVRVNNPGQASGKGGVFSFNLNDPLSKMTIYYTENGVPNKKFDFLINTDCADFTHMEINNAGTSVQQVLNDTISGQVEFYAQAFKNRAVVNIPGLKNIPKTAIVHKAELRLPVQYQTGAKYPPSDELSVAVEVDDVLSGVGVFAVYDNYYKRYSADIREYVQQLISGNVSTTELILSPKFFINSAERVIFNGPNSLNKAKPQLIITYTEF